MFDGNFYKGKKVLITGHTGFKGTWMCEVLLELGAEITGYALQPPTEPSLFVLIGMEERIHSIEGDVRDLEHLLQVFEEVQPEIVIHMAAQPIVRESYKNPVYTYDVNRENEELNGFDPYSNSKSCSELVTESYKNSFFTDGHVAISTARAGNVIGGGDFAADRIIPDCMRAVLQGQTIELRNPTSTRPYQHVLEPIMAYLLIAEKQYQNSEYAGKYNVGPEESSCLTTEKLVAEFCWHWRDKTGVKPVYTVEDRKGPHEANFLKLDCSKIRSRLGWKPVWDAERMISETVEWIVAYSRDDNVYNMMKKQIEEYLKN